MLNIYYALNLGFRPFLLIKQEKKMFYLYCRKCDRTVFNWKNCRCTNEKTYFDIPQHFSWIDSTKLNKTDRNSNVYSLVLRPLNQYGSETDEN